MEQIKVTQKFNHFPNPHICSLTLAEVYIRGQGKEEMGALQQFHRTSARILAKELSKNTN